MYPHSDPYETSARDRVYGRATTSSEGRRSAAIALLAVSVFLLVISVSCRQATAPGPARNVLQAGLVTLTDIDQLLADEGPAIRQLALESEDEQVFIPGYPLDIVLSRTEVTGSSDSQLRELILQRSASLLYAQGIGAFDRTGEQRLRRFSIQGILEFGVGQVSSTTYDRATIFALISLLGCAFFGAVVAATGSGWNRMRSVGLAAVVGALPLVLLFYLLRLMNSQIGDDDPFISGYRDITNAALGVPLRNSLVVSLAGAAVVALAIVLDRVERLISPSPHYVEGDDY